MVSKYDLITRIFEDDLIRDNNIKRKTVTLVVEQMLSEIKKGLLNGDYIELRTFGSFMVKIRKNRKVWDPKLRMVKSVKEKRVPYFKASSILKKRVQESYKKSRENI